MKKVIKSSKVSDTLNDLAKGFESNNQAAEQAVESSATATEHSQDTQAEPKEEPQPKAKKRAAHINEQGNSNNVFNFDLLIAFVIGFGTRYLPSNSLLLLTHLQSVYALAVQCMADVNSAFNEFKQVLDIRYNLYVKMPFLATRMMGELRSCGASKETISKAQSYNNKIQGRRVAKIDPNSSDKVISASQKSFAQRLNNFDGMVGVCAIEGLYAPAEMTLKINALKAFIEEIQAANTAVAMANAKLANARTERNNVLYHPTTGLVAIALQVKQYVQAVYGFKSPEFKQVHRLKFKTNVKL